MPNSRPKFSLQKLSRKPDIDAPNLHASDASDRLILSELENLSLDLANTKIVTIEDRYGALTLSAIDAGATDVRVFQDGIVHEQALARNAAAFGMEQRYQNLPLGEELLEAAEIILLQLPRSLAELEEIVDAVARWADPRAKIIAGGRVKHMSLAMNDIFRKYFKRLDVTHAKQKSRVLIATESKAVTEKPPFPVWGSDNDLDFELASYGATFGGSKLDHGSRLLLKKLLPELAKMPKNLAAIDLGCGNGSLAVSIAKAHSGVQVTATDQSTAAVLATKLTAERSDVSKRIRVQRSDGCAGLANDSSDFVVLNPPFHAGSIVTEDIALKLIADAHRVLKQQGELWLVMNSHLSYLHTLKKLFAEVQILARDNRFIVIKASSKRI